MKIDAHHHFWKYNSNDFGWISDDMKSIARDFMPNNFKPVLDYHGFDGSVLVQVNQNEEENDFFIGLAKQNEFIKGLVGWVDLKSKDLPGRLAYYNQFSKLKGFRHLLQDEKEGFMDQADFVDGIKMLGNHGYTYDILVYPNQLKEAIRLVKNCSNSNFVLDHMAKPYIKDGKISQWANYIQKLSELPNVMCKVSGLVTEANWKTWKKDDFFIYLDIVFGSFGVDRIMYGSDWPVSLLAADYGQQLDIVESYFLQLTNNEKAKVFGLNAAKFYKL
jgi:L-fuconolactonase